MVIGSLVVLVLLPDASDAYAQVSEEGSVPGGVFEAMFQVEESNGGQIHLDGLV